MVTEHLNFKKTETCFSACLKSHFLYCSQFHNLHVNTTAMHKAAHKAAFIRGWRLIKINTVCFLRKRRKWKMLSDTNQTHVIVLASSFSWSYQQRLLLYVISIDLTLAN